MFSTTSCRNGCEDTCLGSIGILGVDCKIPVATVRNTVALKESRQELLLTPAHHSKLHHECGGHGDKS